MLEFLEASFQYAPGRGIVGANLKVAPGEVLGVVGGNGAGKSTLLGLAAAAMVPQSGEVRLSLTDLAGRTRRFRTDAGLAYRRRVGYLTELAPVYEDLTVVRYLRFRAKVRGERFLRIRRRVNEALERCGLVALRRERIGRLSLGLRRRVALAEALLTVPPVLVLDDPFAGIDAGQRAAFSGMIREVSARSHVLISGHDPQLLSACCTGFCVVRQGKVLPGRLTAQEAMAVLNPPPTKQAQEA